MIYLRFITERWSIESRLIRFGTRWWPSHVEFYNDVAGTTLGSRIDGGVNVRPRNYCKPSREELWTAPGIEAAYAEGMKVVGAKYDWLDILGFTFARDWHRAGRYICSAFVDACFKRISYPLTNLWMPIHRVSPRDLLVSPKLQFERRVI